MGLIVETKDGGFHIVPTWVILLIMILFVMLISSIASLGWY